MATCLTSSDSELGLYRVFIPQLSRGYLGLTEAMHFIFQVDWVVIFAASLVWCVQAIWDLRLMGKTDVGVGKGIMMVALGSLLLGPGAVIALVWLWREDKLVEKGREKAV